MKRHLIITGTGRCGTTFLVQLLTQLRLDTGFADTSSSVHPNCDAGMEWDIRQAGAPYIVKSPFLCGQLDSIMAGGGIANDHVIVPVRDLFAAAESRRDVQSRTTSSVQPIPGGLTGVDRPEDQESELAMNFHELFVALAKWDIPHTLVSFPRIVNDPVYLFGKIKPLIGETDYAAFLEAFTAVARPQIVHTFVPPVDARGPVKSARASLAPMSMKVLPQPTASNPLWQFFRTNTGPMVHKWHHYFDIYHHHFARYRNTNVCLLEFGVSHGGSLKMWRDYFGPLARIIGVDINPDCAMHASGKTEVIIGDQSDPVFLKELRQRFGGVDILIDDGGHTMNQQLTTFHEMFDAVAADGVYLIEDLHTSYWPEYGGGWKQSGTCIEFAKSLLDRLNAWHSRDPELAPDGFSRSVTGLHFYDSLMVIEKMRNVSGPKHSMQGHPTLPIP